MGTAGKKTVVPAMRVELVATLAGRGFPRWNDREFHRASIGEVIMSERESEKTATKPSDTLGQPAKKAPKPPKPRKVEKRQRGRKG